MPTKHVTPSEYANRARAALLLAEVLVYTGCDARDAAALSDAGWAQAARAADRPRSQPRAIRGVPPMSGPVASVIVLARRCANCAERVPVSELADHQCSPPPTAVVVRLERRRVA